MPARTLSAAQRLRWIEAEFDRLQTILQAAKGDPLLSEPGRAVNMPDVSLDAVKQKSGTDLETP